MCLSQFTEWDVWTNFGQQLNSTCSYDPTEYHYFWRIVFWQNDFCLILKKSESLLSEMCEQTLVNSWTLSTSSSYDPTLGALWFFGGQTFCVTKYLIFDCPKNLVNFAWREVWINSSYDPTFTTLGPHSPILIYFVC